MRIFFNVFMSSGGGWRRETASCVVVLEFTWSVQFTNGPCALRGRGNPSQAAGLTRGGAPPSQSAPGGCERCLPGKSRTRARVSAGGRVRRRTRGPCSTLVGRFVGVRASTHTSHERAEETGTGQDCGRVAGGGSHGRGGREGAGDGVGEGHRLHVSPGGRMRRARRARAPACPRLFAPDACTWSFRWRLLG